MTGTEYNCGVIMKDYSNELMYQLDEYFKKKSLLTKTQYEQIKYKTFKEVL